METIWKFPFEIKETVEIKMPYLSEILALQVQDDKPCIWAKVYSDAPIVNRRFNVFGTGHMMPLIVQQRKYIGTFQMWQFVYHVFELKN